MTQSQSIISREKISVMGGFFITANDGVTRNWKKMEMVIEVRGVQTGKKTHIFNSQGN